MGSPLGSLLRRWLLLPAGAHRLLRECSRYTKDPRAIALADHREIAIVIGSPPSTIPVRGNFSQA